MVSLFRPPGLDPVDHEVIQVIHSMRRELGHLLGTPRRWHGQLRRTSLARAIRGSNSIEGYHVSVDDAVAAVDEEQPLAADERTWSEIIGYRSAMSFVLQAGQDPEFRYDPGVLRSMHFMLLSHDLSKGPGLYRQSTIYVNDESGGRIVYEGPDAHTVPELVRALMTDLNADRAADPLVKAAMAHLNLVMIHPFRDGNGRMARAVQTLVLARDAIVAPQFASIEEWLGSNTQSYYRVLAATGGGSWRPERDTHLWVKFNLRAHHMQAQTVRRRMASAERLWLRLEEVVAQHHLPARTANALYDGAAGLRVRRPAYAKLAEVEGRTATRDLAQLVESGLLSAEGATRGRYYRASDTLRSWAAAVQGTAAPLDDPYPRLEQEIDLSARGAAVTTAGRGDEPVLARTLTSAD